MSGGRPSRGAKVVYREVDSDDSDYDYDEFTKVVTVEHFEDNSEDEDYTPGDNVTIPDAPPKVRSQLKFILKMHHLILLIAFAGCLPSTDPNTAAAAKIL